jgi:hypothetical protein
MASASYTHDPGEFEGEEWRSVPRWDGFYEVSSLGRIRSLDRFVARISRWGSMSQRPVAGTILKPAKRQAGHLFVTLSVDSERRSISVHRIVLCAFSGDAPEGTECRHLDGDPTNNRISNLVWGTRLENMADRTRLGEHNAPRGTRNRRAVLTEDNVRYIRSQRKKGRSFGQIALALGVSRGVVWKVVSGHTWGWLD